MRFLPKEEKFFEQFNHQTRIIAQAAETLADGVTKGNSHLKLMAPRIEELEHEGDEVVHELFTRLNQTFITPLDPEDIDSLCSRLDDVLDGIEDVAHRLLSYRIDPIPGPIVQICNLIHDCSRELTKAVAALDGVPEPASSAVDPWLDDARARLSLDRTVASLEARVVAVFASGEATP